MKIEETALKDKKLRNNEYYGVQSIYDDLYQRGFKNQKFHSLMKLIMSKENLLLAYRNIKRNKGSFTPSCDFKTIRDIGNLSEPQYLEKMKRKLENYNPSVV
ncbi:group II intron reverse transcriptase/maturase, partial [Enterococcus pallens]